MVAYCELSVCLVSTNVSDFELSALPVYVKQSKPELSVYLNAAVESEFGLSFWSRSIAMLNHPICLSGLY